MSGKLESKLSLQAAEETAYPTARRAWYVLGLLTLVYVFSFLDRSILSLLVAPIRHDLHITDTQVSLLMGFSFAVFYTFFGLPIGRMADSYSRRKLNRGRHRDLEPILSRVRPGEELRTDAASSDGGWGGRGIALALRLLASD